MVEEVQLPATSTRPRLDRYRRVMGTLSSPARSLPSWLVIGTQRGGTSSLSQYLGWHPGVQSAQLKEVDYFTYFSDRPLAWYRSHFPIMKPGKQTGEASPSYLFDERAPSRIAEALPEARFVALLRDPVERAISHYSHQRRKGLENLGLQEALQAEEERTAGERERAVADPHYRPLRLRHWSYVQRGLYAEQLERWFAVVDRERILVLSSEELYEHPSATYARTLEFLGLAPFEPETFPQVNAAPRDDVDPGVRQRLAERFAEPNERLFALLGTRYGWTAPTPSGAR